ncbi:MAG: alpha/beta hydrolase family protein [Syntrophobacteraceae bacterium]
MTLFQHGTRELLIPAADGHIVPATLVCAGQKRLVIMSHGITGDREEEGVHSGFAELLFEQGFDSIRFDFRGHGKSAIASRDAAISGMMLDFMAVVRWAREQNYQDLFHVATSFGASITLMCVGGFSFSDFAAVTFWNPVIDYGHVFVNPLTEWGRKHFGQVNRDELPYRPGVSLSDGAIVVGPQMMMELFVLRPQDTVWPKCPPLLIIHGDRDTCVSCEDSKSYHAKNFESVTLYTLPGADHGFGDKLFEAYEATLGWFAEKSGL